MLSEKVKDRPLICRIFFATSGLPELVNEAQILQNFFDTSTDDLDYEQIYTTQSKSSFQESSSKSRAGYKYEQQLNLSFPITAIDRSEKLKHLELVKYVAIELTNKRFLFIGRNDTKQNKPVQLTYTTDERIANIQVNSKSLFPIGYTFLESLFGFPFLIPNQTG